MANVSVRHGTSRRVVGAGQVPEAIHRLPLAMVEKRKEERRKEIAEQVRGKYTSDQVFKLHETKSTVEKVRAEVEAARNAELKFDGIKAKPVWLMKAARPCFHCAPRRSVFNRLCIHDGPCPQVPSYPKHGADVKLTVASVLREDALFRKKQQEEAALIQAYESELRDTTSFNKWKAEMKERDEKARLAAVEALRLEMAAAAKEAKEARCVIAHCARGNRRCGRGLVVAAATASCRGDEPGWVGGRVVLVLRNRAQ